MQVTNINIGLKIYLAIFYQFFMFSIIKLKILSWYKVNCGFFSWRINMPLSFNSKNYMLHYTSIFLVLPASLDLNFTLHFNLFAYLRVFWHKYHFITLYFTALRLCFVILMCLCWFQHKLSQFWKRMGFLNCIWRDL